jgi:hypothetical protein
LVTAVEESGASNNQVLNGDSLVATTATTATGTTATTTATVVVPCDTLLAEELIDNSYNSASIGAINQWPSWESNVHSDISPLISRTTGDARSGIGAPLTPTK